MKKFRSKNAWLHAAISALVLLMCSCGGGESSIMRLVPAESCAIMTIDWSSIRANRELRRLINGDQFETLLQGIGVNSETVKSVTIFSSMDAQALSGLLLSGPFHRDEIASQLKLHGWNEASLEHNHVYVHANDYIAFPSSNILFAGTREGVLAVLRAENNAAESILTSDAYKKINSTLSLNGRPVKAFLLIPQGTLDMADAALTATSVALSLFNLGGVGQLLKAVNIAKGFALIVDSGVQEKYPMELCVLMRDEASAALVSGSLNAMKTISEMTSSDNREQESLRALRQMSIVRKKEVLAVRMEVPGTVLFPPSSR